MISLSTNHDTLLGSRISERPFVNNHPLLDECVDDFALLEITGGETRVSRYSATRASGPIRRGAFGNLVWPTSAV
jgi:hypothetical protein